MTTLAYNDHDSLTAGAGQRILNAVLGTNASWSNLILRAVLGLVMFPHGAQKVLGWYGGYGISGTLGYFNSAGIPTFLGVLVLVAEFAGSIALVFGFATRIAALGVASVLTVAALMMHRSFFFMNWSGQQSGEGFEYHLLAVAMAVVLMIGGAGRFSVDRALTRK